VEAELLAFHQPQAGEPAGELLQGKPCLQLAETGAQAVVEPLAEWQVLVGVGPRQVEAIRSGNTRGSRPAAASHRNSFAPFGRATPPRVTGRVVTRRHTGTDGSNRSVSSTVIGSSAGLSATWSHRCASRD
jgi:hypothetical protein